MPTPFSRVYHVPIQLSKDGPGSAIGTDIYLPFVDTGTTGIVLPAASIPLFTVPSPGERGWQYLTSSHILYAGWWIEKDVYFNINDPINPVVKSTLKILAVTEKTVCKNWAKNGDTDKCSDQTATLDPKDFGILGIGFGRRGPEQPQAFPDKNPTLKITAIGPTTPSWPTFHPGYQIDRRGITVGLTDANMDPYTRDQEPPAQLENPSSGGGGGGGSSLPDVSVFLGA
jgi:hypothetical protein